MDHPNYSPGNLTILSLLILLGVLYICVWSTSLNNQLSFHQNSSWKCPSSSPSKYRRTKFPVDNLEVALEKASMPNKSVIIVVVNKAYVEQRVEELESSMLDIFVESLWAGEDTRHLLDHLLVVAVDQAAYDRCMFKRLHCYMLETGVDLAGEKTYMSHDFVSMMWRRTLFLLDVLNHGYSFIFTDADVVWLRNPFSRLSQNQSIDIQMSTDWFNGDPFSEKNFINTGFYFVRSNNHTLSLFQAWYSMKDNSTGKKEQDVLLGLLQNGTYRQWNLDPLFLDTLYFSGFCTDSKDIKAVTTVHANCCRTISAKIKDLKGVLRDWKRFKLTNGANFVGWSPHLACWNSWHNITG